MKLIAHRGNLRGAIPEMENNPDYIMEALNEGFDVEIDVWNAEGRGIWLGHDFARFYIPIDFLLQHSDKLWIHAKNIEALEKLSQYNLNYFWHETDKYTLTSKGYIWTYPGYFLTSNSICVMSVLPEQKVAGLCNDYVAYEDNK